MRIGYFIIILTALYFPNISIAVGQTTLPAESPTTTQRTTAAEITRIPIGGSAQSGTNSAPVSPANSILVEGLKAIAWPIAVLIIAFFFRRPISSFMNALGSRITKLSVFKVELELVPATAATTTPLLDDIRTATSRADINDSRRRLIEQVQSGDPADFALISLGDGKEWLTSRLYIAAAMMERMRGVKVFVFVERSPSTTTRFVALTSVRQLRWALARRFPWLEAAFATVQLSLFPLTGPSAKPDPRTLIDTPVFKSDTGTLDRVQARNIVGQFVELLQMPAGPSPNETEWVTLHGGTTKERATWVTREFLASILPDGAFDTWAPVLRDAPRAHRTRAVLRRAGDFVALVEEKDREFVRLANRRVLLEEVAASVSEEPEI